MYLDHNYESKFNYVNKIGHSYVIIMFFILAQIPSFMKKIYIEIDCHFIRKNIISEYI